jgi:hypothetical protein
VALWRTFHGLYPYSARTYLNNQITPLPGALLLAAPFWALGDSAYQNLFWIPALFVAFAKVSPRGRALVYWLCAVFLAPAVFEEMMVGGDYATNSIYVAVATLLLIRVAADPGAATWKSLLAAALWGVAVCSRLNYVIIVPVVLIHLFFQIGLKRTCILAGIAAFTALALALPFYFANPAEFSPLHVTSKMNGAEVTPPLILAAEALVFIVPFVLAAMRWARSEAGMMFVCAAGLIFPTLAAFALRVYQRDSSPLTFLAFAVSGVTFAIVGYLLAGSTSGQATQTAQSSSPLPA